jgi:predicted nucleotidyltransferase
MIAMEDNKALKAELLVIRDRLDSAGVCWALFAGAAAACYGSKRDVTDLDVLVKEEDLGKAWEALNGVVSLDVAGCLKLNGAGGVYSFFMDEEMVERIKLKPLLSVNVPVVPVEDNILFKAILQRGEAENKFDVEDIRDMVNHEKIDAAYLKRRMKKYGG